MAVATLRRWGRSLGVVVPRAEVLRQRLRPGQRVRVSIEPLPCPDDFSDVAGTVRWKKTAQGYKDELRLQWGNQGGMDVGPAPSS